MMPSGSTRPRFFPLRERRFGHHRGRTALGPATPLHYVEFHPNDHPLVMLAPSLGDAVHRWVEMYEAGYYHWDEAGSEWDFSRHDAAPQPTDTLLI